MPNDGMASIGAPVGAPVARRSLADVLAAGMRRLSLTPTAMDPGAPSLRVKLSKARRVVKAEPVPAPAPAALPDISPKSWSEAELQKGRADFENDWLGNVELRDQARASRKREEEAKHERKRELLDAYVDIMRTRFERRLTVDITAEEGVADARVPPLLLQPLVENAVKYGVATRDSDGRIEVDIAREGSRLRVVVRDDGPGASDAGPALLEKGLGLSTTAERLKQMYGEDHTFTIENAAQGGLQLSIAIPFRTDDVREAGPAERLVDAPS